MKPCIYGLDKYCFWRSSFKINYQQFIFRLTHKNWWNCRWFEKITPEKLKVSSFLVLNVMKLLIWLIVLKYYSYFFFIDDTIQCLYRKNFPLHQEHEMIYLKYTRVVLKITIWTRYPTIQLMKDEWTNNLYCLVDNVMSRDYLAYDVFYLIKLVNDVQYIATNII